GCFTRTFSWLFSFRRSLCCFSSMNMKEGRILAAWLQHGDGLLRVFCWSRWCLRRSIIRLTATFGFIGHRFGWLSKFKAISIQNMSEARDGFIGHFGWRCRCLCLLVARHILRGNGKPAGGTLIGCNFSLSYTTWLPLPPCSSC